MIKVYLCLLFVLFRAYVYGQNGKIDEQVNAFNKVHHQVFKKVKPQGYAYVIKVRSQKEFDGLNEVINYAIETGRKNIRVKLARGTYCFKENHIVLKELYKDVAIAIVGKKAVLTSCSDLRDAENDPWQEMMQMDEIIQVVDKERGLCMISYPNKWTDEMRRVMTKVQVTQWFRAPVYDVERIDDKGIYFIANDLQWEEGYAYKGYNVNFDYLYAGKIPRFRLYDKRKAVTASASCFLKMENTNGVIIEMSNITFMGNKIGQALIAMNNVESRQIYIHNCKFERIHNNVGNFSNVSNVSFNCNIVKNTDGREVRFVNNCKNVQVTNNHFENCGKHIGNTFCVTCVESNYYIANNTFCDIGYGAIGVGVWHGATKEYPSRGIIEHNEIFFSPSYYANVWKHTLLDSGAIYTWTQNDQVIIRYNFIHDYSGIGDNRGIFCDGGANNLKIYGNVVLNTPNSYSIDSRIIKDQHERFSNNANNFMAYNVVDNKVRFQGYGDEERHCVKGPNFVVRGENAIENKFENLEENHPDIEIKRPNLKTIYPKYIKKLRIK